MEPEQRKYLYCWLIFLLVSAADYIQIPNDPTHLPYVFNFFTDFVAAAAILVIVGWDISISIWLFGSFVVFCLAHMLGIIGFNMTTNIIYNKYLPTLDAFETGQLMILAYGYGDFR